MPLKRLLAKAMKSKETELQEEYQNYLRETNSKDPRSFYQWKQYYYPDKKQDTAALKRRRKNDEDEEFQTARTKQTKNRLMSSLDESDMRRYGR